MLPLGPCGVRSGRERVRVDFGLWRSEERGGRKTTNCIPPGSPLAGPPRPARGMGGLRKLGKLLPPLDASVLLLLGCLLLYGLVQVESTKLPLVALWAAGMTGMLFVFLPWYRKRSLLSSSEARRRQAEANAAKRLLAKKCCRNCGTEFPNQSPGGSKGEYKCSACGLTSKRPRLLIPGEADSEDLSPRGAASGDGRASTSKGDKAGDKKREEPARQATKARSTSCFQDTLGWCSNLPSAPAL